jgi:hypothetical protein
MAKKNAAIVTVTSEWISKNGFGGLFKGAFAASTGNAMIEATDHSLTDHSFVEVEFPPILLFGPCDFQGSLCLDLPLESVSHN